jgi:HAD superfamily hydrolase (TIGR01548 family)
MAERLLVFDMDGVLAEVSESFRASIVETVRHFTGQTVSRARIQDYKNQGGWNNDWALSQRICQDLGVEVSYENISKYFTRIFLGENGAPGLIMREQWVPRHGLLESLARTWRLGIFTGRLKLELAPTLARFAVGIPFDPIITTDDIQRGKPDPEGLLLVKSRCPGAEIWYVGDTVDDARCARAVNAPFIGIASRDNPRRAELIELLAAERAIAILDNVNEIEGALPR